MLGAVADLTRKPSSRSKGTVNHKSGQFYGIQVNHQFELVFLTDGHANLQGQYPGPGGTSILGSRGAWPQDFPLKFLLEPQILPPKITW